MINKNTRTFKLDPEWLFKTPIDFEYNKYTLLGYIQKCENNFNELKIYPDFIELSLHLANLHSILRDNTMLVTEKEFESFDDEILLKDLIPKKLRELNKEETIELNRTIRYSGNKLFETFNIAKSIWTLAFDRINLELKRNSNKLSSKTGYSYYIDSETDKFYIWKYERDGINNKVNITLMSDNIITKKNSRSISKQVKEAIGEKDYKQNPIFECISSDKFPIENTLVPIMKRKITSYILQTINFKKK